MLKQIMHVYFSMTFQERLFRPNKKISVFRVTGLKILGRVDTHKILLIFFLEKKYNLMHFEKHIAFQNE